MANLNDNAQLCQYCPCDDTVVLACLERIEIPSQTLYTNIALMYIYCLIY